MSVLLRKQYSSIKKEKLSEQAKSVLKSMYDTTNGFKDAKATRKIKPKFEAFYNKLKESKPEAIVGGKAKAATPKAAPKKSADDFKAARARRKKQTGVPKDKNALEKDAVRPAISKRGRRVSKAGNTYYEYRDNRLDKNPSKYPMLAKGGELTEDQQLKLRLELVLDDLKAIKEFIYENGLSETFEKPTKHSDECWTLFNNIEIACDLNDDESLSWGKFYKEKKAKGGELTEDQQLKLRLELVLDDLKAIKEFIYENGLSETFEKPTKHSDECWTLFNNIEIACDLNDDESLSWGKFYKEKVGYMAKGGELDEKYEIELFFKGLSGDNRKIGKYVVTQKTLDNLEEEWSHVLSIDVIDESDSKPISWYELKKELYSKGKEKGFFAKGGETKVPNTYIPNRDVKELMVVLKNESFKLKGSDILDGVYAKNSSLKSSKKDGNSNLYDKIVKLAKEEKYDKEDLKKIKEQDVTSLLSANYNENEIIGIYFGLPQYMTIKTDVESFSKLLNYNLDYVSTLVEKYVEVAQNRKFELGLEYPSFDWKSVINKYDIKNEPIKIKKEQSWGENEFKVYTYEIFKGKDVVIGHLSGIETFDKKTNKLKDKYNSFFEVKDYNKVVPYQKERDYPAGFNGGYWGVVSSKKDVVKDIAEMLLSQEGSYTKEVQLFVNDLGGVDIETLDKNNIKYEQGGYMAKGGKTNNKKFTSYTILNADEYGNRDSSSKMKPTKFYIVWSGNEYKLWREQPHTIDSRIIFDNDNDLMKAIDKVRYSSPSYVNYGLPQDQKFYKEFIVSEKFEYADGGYMAKGGETHRLDGIFEDGGEIAEGNLQMAMSNVKALEHHAKELQSLLDENTSIEAWVVAKLERAETDLSDVTHYIDGLKGENVESDTYFAKGGKIKDSYTYKWFGDYTAHLYYRGGNWKSWMWVVSDKNRDLFSNYVSDTELKDAKGAEGEMMFDIFQRIGVTPEPQVGIEEVVEKKTKVVAKKESPKKIDNYEKVFTQYLIKDWSTQMSDSGWKFDYGNLDGTISWYKDDLKIIATPFWDNKEAVAIDVVRGEDNLLLQDSIPFKPTYDLKSDEKNYMSIVEPIMLQFNDKFAKGGELTPYIIWVSKDGEKREMFGEYKSKRAADMKMNKLWESGEYKTMGNKPKSMYEKEGFYKDGGMMAEGGKTIGYTMYYEPQKNLGGKSVQSDANIRANFKAMDAVLDKNLGDNYLGGTFYIGDGYGKILLEDDSKENKIKGILELFDFKDATSIYSKEKGGYTAKGGRLKELLSKAKSLSAKGYEKAKHYGKKGYDKTKEYTKKQIHDQKKKIALDVIDETIYNYRNDKNEFRQHLAAAEELIEEGYAKGGYMAKGGRLSRKQKQLDLNKNGKLDAQDFKMLRAGRKNARKK
jgi:hypothetical protein